MTRRSNACALVDRLTIRDLRAGAWARAGAVAEALANQEPSVLTLINVDALLWTEADGHNRPLCFLETAVDRGQTDTLGLVADLARRADLPGYTVLVKPATGHADEGRRWSDIESFRVRRLYPQAELAWRTITPAKFSEALFLVREWQKARYELEAAANDSNY